MPVTIDWSTDTPHATDNVTVATTGVTAIQQLKTAVHERMRNGGAIWATTAALSTLDGRVSCGLIGTNTLNLYESNGTTSILAINDSATQEVTLGDGTTGSNPYIAILGGYLRGLSAQAGGYVAQTQGTTPTSYTVPATAWHVRFTCTASGTEFPLYVNLGGTTPATYQHRLVTVSYVNTVTATKAIVIRTAAGLRPPAFDIDLGGEYVLTPTASNVPRVFTAIQHATGTLMTWRVLEIL